MWAFKSVVIFISRSFSSLCNVKCFIDVALVLGSSRKQNKWGTCYYSPIPNAISRWCFALFQKSSLTRCFSKCNACMRSTHLYVTMVTHTTCVWSGGFVQPMYIHTDYGRILLKILVGEMAAQPIFKEAEKERCGGGVNRGEALRPFLSVEVSSPSPLNLVTIILNPLLESHPYMWHVWNTYWSHHRERAMGMGEKKLAPHGSSLVFLFSDDLVPRLYRRLFEIVCMEKVRETTRDENWNHVKKDLLKYSWHLNQDTRVILWNFCDLTLLRFDWHALTW